MMSRRNSHFGNPTPQRADETIHGEDIFAARLARADGNCPGTYSAWLLRLALKTLWS